MVESQVRPSDVSDRPLLRAMLDVPRELFVPAWTRSVAYADSEVPVTRDAGVGRRCLLPARTLAKLIQAAQVEPTDRVLDVACATGYSSAVLARLAKDVTGLESDAALCAAGREALRTAGIANVKIEQGPLAEGWMAGAPYDVILLNVSASEVPRALLDQLAEGGRLVAIVAGASGFGVARVYLKRGGVGHRALFDAGAPALAELTKRAEFAF